MATPRNKITPFLWFDHQAEEAAKFYISIFRNSKIGKLMPGPDGKVMGLSFTLDGQEFRALNGGPQFKFSPAISLFVDCNTQKEVDELWEKLSAGGQKQPCGWLQDKYGVSWQIIPTVLGKLLADKDRRKAQKVMQAMLQMQKLDIKGLEAAHG
jgi:predicted 3-demethylubiquinone-9 3-methyltransferase (glyoxalase superfamily)